MRTFDEYLAELRGRLQVGPRRAQEICEEARCHLEAQAQQFERQGLSREEAAAKAIAAFGEPAAVAQVLTKANEQHYRAQIAKALGLGVLIGSAIWYVGIVVLWLVGLTAHYALTTYWYASLIPGAIFGALCGLLISAWRVRMRWVIITFAAAPVLLFWSYLYLLFRAGGFADASMLLRGGATSTLPLPIICSAIALAVAWAVHRWVLRAPKDLPTPMEAE
jgi:hypothetical protein